MTHLEACFYCYLLLLIREANAVRAITARALIGVTAYGIQLLSVVDAPRDLEMGLLTVAYSLLLAEEAHLVPSSIAGLSRATVAYAAMAAISLVLLSSGSAW